jgi:hypothetical protein
VTEAEWLATTEPNPMLRHLIGVDASVRVQDVEHFQNARGSGRKLRLFACACYHRVSHRLLDDRAANAVAVAEDVAEGVLPIDMLRFADSPLRSVLYQMKEGWRSPRGDERDAMTPTYNALALASVILCREPEKAAYYASSNAYLAVETLDNPLLSRSDADYSTLGMKSELVAQTHLLRDIFGNPFRPVAFDPLWRSPTAVALACAMYESRNFSTAPILADALEEAGCDSAGVLLHLRAEGVHQRGCWVVDALLRKA